jgi:predicted dinucleotide-binding enzyme
LGAEAASTQDVVIDVDVVLFSMPFNAYKNLPKDLLENVPKDVGIIDTSNYYPMRDGDISSGARLRRVPT